PESDWRLIYNGLDLEHFVPDSVRRERFRNELGAPGALLIGAACALRPGKQLEQLFATAARITSPNVPLVLAGGPVSGEEAYAAKLLEEGKRKLGERLIHLGHLHDLRDFFNGLDVCVNTSMVETCSISILQSLACGCPVVGYPSKSVDEQILPDGGEIVPQ